MTKTASIPMGMVFRKFYCRKCGTKLKNNPITRTLHPGDPGYHQARKVGKTYYVGDVQYTEYNFKCPSCAYETQYLEQCVYRRIQKMLGKHVLTDDEIRENKLSAQLAQDRSDMITKVCAIVGFGILVLVLAALAEKIGK